MQLFIYLIVLIIVDCYSCYHGHLSVIICYTIVDNIYTCMHYACTCHIIVSGYTLFIYYTDDFVNNLSVYNVYCSSSWN